MASDIFSNHLSRSSELTDAMLRESVSSTVGGLIERVADQELDRLILGKNSEFNGLVTAYMATGKSKEEAEDLAWNSLRHKLVRGMLDDIGSGLSYGLGISDNSVKRSLFK